MNIVPCPSTTLRARKAVRTLSVVEGCIALILLSACTRKETAETYTDGQRKLVRTYSWPGPKDSRHLRLETAYFFNGKIESETHFHEGKVEGDFKAWWQNGQIKAAGHYSSDKPEGKWEYYYNAFTLAAKGAFHDGLKEGLWTEYWENGELRRRGEYRAGKETGEWLSWNSAGGETLRTSCFESNDSGRYRSSYDNGSVKEEYACRRGHRTGLYVENNAEGEPSCRGFYDTTGAEDSLWVWFHSNGRLAGRQRFRNGLQNDSALSWDSAGRVTQRGFFRLGTGTFTRYDSLGRTVEIRSFRDGAPLLLRRWHSNGEPAVEGAFAEGKKTGLWKILDERGRLRESAEYLKGELHGERRFYDSTGALMRVQKYFHGIPTKGSFPGLGNSRRPRQRPSRCSRFL